MVRSSSRRAAAREHQSWEGALEAGASRCGGASRVKRYAPRDCEPDVTSGVMTPFERLLITCIRLLRCMFRDKGQSFWRFWRELSVHSTRPLSSVSGRSGAEKR